MKVLKEIGLMVRQKALAQDKLRGSGLVKYKIGYEGRVGLYSIVNGYKPGDIAIVLNQIVEDLDSIDYKYHILFDVSNFSMPHPRTTSSLAGPMRRIAYHPNCGQLVMVTSKEYIKTLARGVMKVIGKGEQLRIFPTVAEAKKYIESLL